MSDNVAATVGEMSTAVRSPTVGLHDGAPAGLAFKVYLAAVFLMPLQLEIPAVESVIDSRLPPGDFLLALSVLLAPSTLKIRRIPVAMLPLAMIGVLAYGMALALLYAGNVTDHTLLVKFVGAIILAVWCLTTVSWTRDGHGPRILRAWLVGMAVWGVVSYIDWKFVDIVPFLDAKITSRFGGMQFDPNNAGAAYAVAVVMMWRYGARVFESRLVRLAIIAVFLIALSATLSRGGFVGLAAAVFVVLLIARVGARRWTRYLAIGAVLVAAAFATGFVDDAVDDFDRRPDTVGDRGELAEGALRSFVDSGGTGIGLGTYYDEAGEIVHNTAIWLMVEMSLVGVVFLTAMFLTPAHAALRLRAFDRDLAFALLGGHVVMVVASVGIEALYQRQWWLIIGLCVWPKYRLAGPTGVRA